MATLTTSPQEIINNTSNTIATRLFAWYSDQSGNEATVHLKLQACSQGITYTGTNKAYAMTCGSTNTGAVSWAYAPLNANQWYDVAEITYRATGGSQVYCRGSVWTYVYGDSVCETSDVYLPTFYTAPTGLGIDSIVRGIEDFTARVYLSSWGNNSGGTKYRELQVWTKGMTEPRRYQPAYGNSLSGNITANNSSSGSLTIKGNTEYTLGAYATNGNVATGSQNKGNYTTRAYAPTLSANKIGEDYVTIDYSTRADGGKYTKSIQYSLDGGTTWVTGATVSTGSASSGTFTISNLSYDTSYTLKCRVSTSAGTTVGSDVAFRTLKHCNSYVSVNGKSKTVNKMHCSVNGKSKSVLKLYASVNGKSKLVYRHNNAGL